MNSLVLFLFLGPKNRSDKGALDSFSVQLLPRRAGTIGFEVRFNPFIYLPLWPGSKTPLDLLPRGAFVLISVS